MLIAMPSMEDRRFNRSLIYVCAHSDEGAMGIVINRRVNSIAMPELLVQLDVIPREDLIRLPDRAGKIEVLAGGPLETTRGFVLHSTDMRIDNATLEINEGIGLTVTIDMLRAIARGNGPERAALALGYSGWSPGQLEQEIQANAWLHAAVSFDLIFDADHEHKYDRALRRMGIDPVFLSIEAGRA